jgi:hypothetical protein
MGALWPLAEADEVATGKLALALRERTKAPIPRG